MSKRKPKHTLYDINRYQERCMACNGVLHGTLHESADGRRKSVYLSCDNCGYGTWMEIDEIKRGGGMRSPVKPEAITEFRREYGFLSNFAHTPVMFEGVMYPTAEHAFQAAKTLNVFQRSLIRLCPTPGAAKKAGRNIKLREDWLLVRVTIMRTILRSKFTSRKLREQLLATGDAHLEEENYWNDKFWGTVNGEGANTLGRLLMEIRGELRGKAR